MNKEETKISSCDLFFEIIDNVYNSKNNILFFSYSIFSGIDNSFYKNNKNRIKFEQDIWEEYSILKKNYEYIYKQYEFLLEQFSNELNKIHNKNYSKRYWRILIGPWIFLFISIIFERWFSIRGIFKNNKIEKIFIRQETKNYVTTDIDEFRNIYILNDWNHNLYNKILKYFKNDNYVINYYKSNNDTQNYLTRSLNLSFKQKIVKTLLRTSFTSFFKNKDYLFFSSGFDRKRKKIINKNLEKSVFLPPIPKFLRENFQVDKNLRDRLTIKEYDNTNFSKFLVEQIKENIPLVYLELFDEHIKFISKYNYPSNPKSLINASGLMFNSNMSRYVAEKIEEKSQLINIQHGGTYGQYDLHWPTKHEIEISDKFLTWGWTQKDNLKVIPIGINKNIPKYKVNENNTKILFEIRVRSNYTGRLDSATTKSRIKKYIIRCGNFFEKIKNTKLNNDLIVRMHPRTLGYEEKKIFKKFNNMINYCDPYVSIFDLKKNLK
jgi:putative transferase (TIGR04331 family)